MAASIHFISTPLRMSQASTRINWIGARRTFAKKKPKNAVEDPCRKNETCGKKSRRSIWKLFKKEKVEPCSTQEQLDRCNQVRRPDPDLSRFEGTVYRTCGTGYIVQKEQLQGSECVQNDDKAATEEKMLERIEKHPDLKDQVDPMPPFESSELRLIQLSERKLHPFYKRYMSMPKKPSIHTPKYEYKSRSGPIGASDIPAHLNVKKELLERKNIFSDFKMVEPPRQLIAQMLEIKQNAKPTLERKIMEKEERAQADTKPDSAKTSH